MSYLRSDPNDEWKSLGPPVGFDVFIERNELREEAHAALVAAGKDKSLELPKKPRDWYQHDGLLRTLIIPRDPLHCELIAEAEVMEEVTYQTRVEISKNSKVGMRRGLDELEPRTSRRSYLVEPEEVHMINSLKGKTQPKRECTFLAKFSHVDSPSNFYAIPAHKILCNHREKVIIPDDGGNSELDNEYYTERENKDRAWMKDVVQQTKRQQEELAKDNGSQISMKDRIPSEVPPKISPEKEDARFGLNGYMSILNSVTLHMENEGLPYSRSKTYANGELVAVRVNFNVKLSLVILEGPVLRWVRGVVLKDVVISTGHEGRYKVHLIDYGAKMIVHVADLRPLPKKFLSIPAITYRMKLYGVSPITGIWTAEATQAFKEMMRGRFMTVDIIRAMDPIKDTVDPGGILAEEVRPLEVVVTFPAHEGINPEYFNVATELVKLGLAVPIDKYQGNENLLEIYNLDEIDYFLAMREKFLQSCDHHQKKKQTKPVALFKV